MQPFAKTTAKERETKRKSSQEVLPHLPNWAPEDSVSPSCLSRARIPFVPTQKTARFTNWKAWFHNLMPLGISTIIITRTRGEEREIYQNDEPILVR